MGGALFPLPQVLRKKKAYMGGKKYPKYLKCPVENKYHS
jgi:hypothetical protein